MIRRLAKILTPAHNLAQVLAKAAQPRGPAGRRVGWRRGDRSRGWRF
jgi:hypothetical protein